MARIKARTDGGRKLDAAKVVETLDHLRARVSERFPDAGLATVCAELTATARTTAQRARRLSRPYLGLRFLVLAVVVVAIGLEVGLFARLDWMASLNKADSFGLAAGLESAVNLIVLSGAAAWFLLSLETRWKRGRVQKALHELRSFAHVIDMHQLTKDPTLVLGPRTASSPAREMNRFQLARYLDYHARLRPPSRPAVPDQLAQRQADPDQGLPARDPDPERGWVLAALTGALSFNAAKPAFIRKAVESRMDAQLFAWSYDYVGDLAETVALVWPERPGANREPDLSEVVEACARPRAPRCSG
jgi:hypothetical protein